MKIYIAGPMRGIENWNFPMFDYAEEIWRDAGHQPFSPAQIDRVLKYSPTTDSGCNDDHLRHVIQMDIACVMAADAIALLPGWEASRGVAVELALAQFLGLPIYDAVTMGLIHPQITPWVYCDLQTES